MTTAFTPPPPRPIVAMPTTTTLARTALEECANELDAAGIRAASLTETPIALPDGTVATIRCSRSARTGALRITISQRAPRATRTEASL